MRRHTYRWIGLLALVGLLGPVLHARGQEPEITVELPGGATMEMVWIVPGTFLMGSPETALAYPSNERPRHRVTIARGFYLGKYELTQEQWVSVMDTRPWNELVASQLDCARCPAVFIGYEEFQAFIDSLNRHADAGRYRLPTEAEWEYAARAGSETTRFWGDIDPIGDYAWYSSNTCGALRSECHVQEVGLKRPNPWGLYDIYGNVWEWCEDWWLRRYTEESQVDPLNTVPLRPDGSSGHVMRGGSFSNPAVNQRSALRATEHNDRPTTRIGVRLVLESLSETTIPLDSWGAVKASSPTPKGAAP